MAYNNHWERLSKNNTTKCASFPSNIHAFHTHGSMHRNSILIISNKMQQYAGIYLLQNYSTCFGCLSHPPSSVHQTVTAASGTGHITYQGSNVLPAWLI